MVITYSLPEKSVLETEEGKEEEKEVGAECQSIGRKSRREGKERQTSKLRTQFFWGVGGFQRSCLMAALLELQPHNYRLQ